MTERFQIVARPRFNGGTPCRVGAGRALLAHEPTLYDVIDTVTGDVVFETLKRIYAVNKCERANERTRKVPYGKTAHSAPLHEGEDHEL